MTYIANPIYDSVFKFMMDDERVARIILSALLKKDVVAVEMKQQEYAGLTKRNISMFRLDFNAKVRNEDGSESIVLIELQKTWLVTETLRFRQYLASQYNDKRNVPEREVNPKGFAYPMVAIYILGHKLGDLEEPVVYVKRNYLDYDSNPIVNGVPDPFVESLTHDSIIVQIPYLKGRLRNKLERVLQVFDQEYCVEGNEHFMEMDESLFEGDEFFVLNRLVMAGGTPEVKRAMEVEDEILSEIEERDTAIMMRDKEIEKKNQELENKNQELENKNQMIDEKNQELENKNQELENKNQELENKNQELENKNQMIDEKNQELENKNQMIEHKNLEIDEKNQMIKDMAKMLYEQGVSADVIAGKLNVTTDLINQYLKD